MKLKHIQCFKLKVISGRTVIEFDNRKNFAVIDKIHLIEFFYFNPATIISVRQTVQKTNTITKKIKMEKSDSLYNLRFDSFRSQYSALHFIILLTHNNLGF